MLISHTMKHHPKAASEPGPRQTGEGSGFTLIELLVVIAIIGVLAGLLLTSLSAAKQRAWRAVDLNNLKQFGATTHMETSDLGDVMPWPNWFSGEDDTNTPPQGWLYTYNPNAIGPAMFDVHTGSFWTELPNPKMFFCPSDNTNSSMFQARPQQSSSYVMNGAVCGYDRAIFPPEKLSQLRPSAVEFWECDDKTLQDNELLFNDGASSPDENASGRHGNVAMCACFDGSAKGMLVTEWEQLVAADTANDLWCFPESTDGR
jgi:prepilin-type N-terminal cleavage/methylation domain-containing protein